MSKLPVISGLEAIKAFSKIRDAEIGVDEFIVLVRR